VRLGRRTITVANATAIKPFGTIDKPNQGETISGIYDVFGWTLTPKPKTVPRDGSTIVVFIDGQPVGSPSYNNPRQDIIDLFPNYNNTDGAVGAFTFNSAFYADGMHQIAWVVTDDTSAADGIGSRFFFVNNSGAPLQGNGERADVAAGALQSQTLLAPERGAGG